jgi:hypothetical protein
MNIQKKKKKMKNETDPTFPLASRIQMDRFKL